jgi:Concanavalin A-like lectin/glucanases superfamily/FG-GAP repeat
MASNDDYPIPTNNDDSNKRQSSRHLPRFYRTEKNEKFLAGALDPLIQPGKLDRINGYIGKKDIPNFSFDDNYLTDITTVRQYYQLESSYVYQDPVTNEPIWFADYMDYMNSLAYYGANTSNHAKLNAAESYAWDPHIDWDKLANFREYYWLPSGPDPITIRGKQQAIVSTYSVAPINEGDRTDYLFTPNGLSVNPRLTLYRGNTYVFNINAKGKPFCIKTEAIGGNSSFYNFGTSAQAVEVGSLIFTVPYEAPDLLYYVDNNDLNSQGIIDIRDIDDNTFLDVDAEITGKVNYTTTTGINLINGLKLKFAGNVIPSKYSKDFWYVEGVGSAIKLINYNDLEFVPYSVSDTTVPFDLQPFDSVPFDNATNYPNIKEYIVINRASRDRNPWTRNNRWFHIDVLNITAAANTPSNPASPDQTARAQRPIIEFLPDLKLFNNGWLAKTDVDLIDTTTKYVFREIEGSLGYYVDNEKLLPGQRVLFTADIDPLVNGRIYKVATVTVNTTTLKFLSVVRIGSNPCNVTFTFEPVVTPPPINVGYTIDSTYNQNFNGLYNAISSTTNSLTLVYPTDPGEFTSGSITGTYDNFLKKPQLTLLPTEDTLPQLGDVVFAKHGTNYNGTSFYYDGSAWQQSQEKKAANQAPLFDLFDNNKISFSDNSYYKNTDFSGNRIFGYRIGTGTNDTELGFPLYYRSIDNIGDIEFEFDLENKIWNYIEGASLKTVYSYQGFLRKVNLNGSFSYLNGWTKTDRNLYQKAVRILQISKSTDLVAIDIFNNSGSIGDINAQVYVNNIKRNDISRVNINGVAFIKFNTSLSVGDKVVYKIQSVANKNDRGYYEIPYNWQNNPFNQTLDYLTLGEAIDQVQTIVENNPLFTGDFPGVSNLSRLNNPSKYGHRFLQHSGSFPLASYLITDKKNNIIDALQWTSTQYSQFKKEFLRIAGTGSFEGTISERVDQILMEFANAKYLDKSPFYFSDMAPYKGYTQRDYTVQDPRLPVFVIDSIFDPKTQDRRSILIYVNEVQLTYQLDYNFSTTDSFVNIIFPLYVNDKITIKDYLTTNGSYIPYTPSKLGIYPSYQPTIYIDDTYLTPVKVIQGHDGSIILAYNDYRDDLILELEKRIYNTKRVNYDDNIFSLFNVLGGYYRNGFTKSFFSSADITNIILPDFLRWNSLLNQDYITNIYYQDENSFTYNYKNSVGPDGKTKLSGFWRSIYKTYYDTDRPHSHPWEMQGFTIKPVWWDKVYGVAPYTSENKVMWNAIEKGIINTPNYRRTDTRFARPGLSNYLPVDSSGNLLSPLDSNLIKEFVLLNAKGSYVFGDGSPVETAWRRSSEFPFAIVKAMCILNGSEFIGKMWDRFTIQRNLAGQIYNKSTNKRFNTADIIYPNTPITDYKTLTKDYNNPNAVRYMTSGLSNILDDYVFSLNSVNLDSYKNILSGLQSKLSHKLGGYSAKDKLNVLLDSRTPNSSGTVFLPPNNYRIFYNQSSPVASIVYSGVLIEKLNSQYSATNSINNDYLQTAPITGYKISGYDKKYGIFQIYNAIPNVSDTVFNVGGITESFGDWTPNQYYTKGFIVKYQNNYFKAIVPNTASSTFETDILKWSKISSLPITGGVSAIKRSKFSDIVTSIPYGTIYPDIQSVVDFLLGYQARLTAVGFKFDNYSQELSVTLDWLTSAKEFMFWSLQNWNTGAIITLSPSATFLQFSPAITASIDDFSSSAFEYSILKADGTPLKLNDIDIHRQGNGFTVKPAYNSSNGIYFIRANLIQREHVLLLDNISDFNDIVYDNVSGYRQGRVKIIGFLTSNWDGGYTTPGFMYDSAMINIWTPYTDYMLGDIVTYKNNNYVAKANIAGSSDFVYENWKEQIKDLPAGLMANWDYRVEQFRDFYNLDASIFDVNQKKLARHLIGYQDRNYLDNIIIDDVAQYKFYQGYIREKGSFNSITKLFDVLRSSGFSTVNLYEDWAFKVGDYGAIDGYSEIEFPLDQSQFRYNPQNIVLSVNKENNIDSSIYNIPSFEVTIKPADYNATPFPLIDTDISQDNYGIFKYRVAGYVRQDDVDHVIYNRAALLNYDISLLREGDKIWLGYTENNDWDVLEYIRVDLIITTWTVDFVTNSHIYLYCNNTKDLSRGDIISISNLDYVNGTYIIQAVANNIITIYTSNILATIPNLKTSGVVHRFISSRYKNLAAVSDKIYNKFNINGEKIWIDSDSNKNWLVLENVNAFSKDEVVPYTKKENQQNGYCVKISGNNQIMIVSQPTNIRGIVVVYKRPNNLSKWAFFQILKVPSDFILFTNYELFGYSLEISYDGNKIFIGIPGASNIKSFFKGTFNKHTHYLQHDIVRVLDASGNYFFYQANIGINGDGTEFDASNWTKIDIYLGDGGGYSSNIQNQGAVAIYEFDTRTTKKYLETKILLSSDPTINENFGSKLKLVEDPNTTDLVLFVAAADYSYDYITKIISQAASNSKTLHFTDTSGIIIGQEMLGLVDPLTGSQISPIVLDVSSTTVILDQYVTANSNSSVIFILSSIGRVHVFRQKSTGWMFNNPEPFVSLPSSHSDFPDSSFAVISRSRYGKSLDCLPDLSVVAISAPFLGAGVVYLFTTKTKLYQSNEIALNGLEYLSFELFEVINSDTLTNGDVLNSIGGYITVNDGFGYELLLTNNSLIISAPNNNSKGTHTGAVFNFQKVKGMASISYQLQEVIIPPVTNTYAYERFGVNLSIDPQGNILTVSAQGGPSVLDTTFDSHSTALYGTYTFNLLSVIGIQGTGPYYIKFTITPQLVAPAVDVNYNISNNSNSNYNGSFLASESTLDTIIFVYNELPGDFGVETITSATNQDLKYILNPDSTSLVPTTFDNNSTRFYDQLPATGAVYVYNRFDDNFIYADRLTPNNDLVAQDNFGFSVAISSNCIAVGTPNKQFYGTSYGSVFVFNYSTPSWKILRYGSKLVDISKFKKSFYYNTLTNKLVENLDLYDPLKGRIPAIADQEIKYQTFYDPAVYEYRASSSLAQTSDQIWTDDHIGELWWDLSTIKYTWYEQGDVVYRNNQWGQLFPGSVVNVYEWVESKYIPSKYSSLADTTAGLAAGISGIPRNTDDLTYSTKIKYDKTSGIVTTLYYFWVSNRKITPNSIYRKLSAYAVASLISDPKSQGYRYISVTGQNSLSITNVKNKLSEKNISLNLQFYEIENTDLQVHREYVLIPKGDKSAIIPVRLENKWFDSFVGLDVSGNQIPDPKLSVRHRYGNLTSPRQTWFVNKSEALKQFIEYVNDVLQSNNILNKVNLKNLYSKETYPTLTSGIIDYQINTIEELSYIGTNNVRTAKISLIPNNGQIYDYQIIDKGYGYGRNKVYEEARDLYGNPTLWYGPTVNISGTGSGASVQTFIDTYGQIQKIEIVKRGSGYGNSSADVTAKVRDFTVLVLSDSEANNVWSLQTYSFINLAAENLAATTKTNQTLLKNWFRSKTQSYDVTRYWYFVDWYASGYSAQTDPEFILQDSSQLAGLNAAIGDHVKITNAGLNNWLLLERVAITNDPDYTVDYHVIGQQSATIKFSSALYNYNSEIGYDKLYSYDLDLYDSSPSVELRIILESIRDDLFVGNLRIEYLNLFFNSIHYILSEQNFVDWFFKTSFLKLNHVVGNLSQNKTFQTDPLSDYESYINEVKPYKTKIREFISSYQGYDYSYNTISDFDLPSYFNTSTGLLETTNITSTYINQYPWANWLENHTYQITDIVINSSGSNYISRPIIIISPPVENYINFVKQTAVDSGKYIYFNNNYYLTNNAGTLGSSPPSHVRGTVANGSVELLYVASNAKATSYIASGSLFKITVDNPGYGFLKSPIITVRGGLAVGGTQAKATAYIGNSKSRSLTLSIKFDRYQKDYQTDSFKFTDIFQANQQSKFKLTYPPEIEKTKFFIKVNEIEYYGNQYSVTMNQELHDTYTALVGYITFSSPVSGTVAVTYYKNIKIYGAADRINYAYSPTSGQYGKDLSQLMTGIDYGGVEFTSIKFNVVGGYDVLPWDVNSWDSKVTQNDDFVVVLSNESMVSSTAEPHSFTLPYTPNPEEVINVYLKPFGKLEYTRIDNESYVVNPNLYLFGNPLYSIEGPFDNSASVKLNTVHYTVALTSLGDYDSNTDTTSLLIDIFSTSTAYRKYQYPKPLIGWLFNGLKLIKDAVRYDYSNWTIVLSGDQRSAFLELIDYSLSPPLADYVEIHPIETNDYNFGTDDFTIEFFVLPYAFSSALDTPILAIGQKGGGHEIRISQNVAQGGIGFSVPNNTNNGNIANGYGSLTTVSWSHIALTRNNNITRFFVNGILLGEITDSTFDFQGYGPIRIGTGFEQNCGFFQGSISNLRITKNISLYNKSFRIPNFDLTSDLHPAIILILNSKIGTNSFIGDGTSNIITLNTIGYLLPGDEIIFRKSTSDGTILPSDQSLLDSLVSGGDLGYNSARGVYPEDIIIDGDDLVSDLDAGPEELVQGHLVDTVDIKVYDAPTTGGPRIVVNNYIGDGISYVFNLNILPPNEDSVAVFIDNKYQVNLNVDFYNKKVELVDDNNNPAPPPLNSKITIYVIDVSTTDALSREIFYGDGMINQFVTSARFSFDNITPYVLIDGVEPDKLTIISSNLVDPLLGDAVVVLETAPGVDSVIQIMMFRGTIQKWSKSKYQQIAINESNIYEIDRPPANVAPLSAYVWVICVYTQNGVIQQDFLRAPDYENFVYPQTIELDSLRYNEHSLSIDMINVYRNNELLVPVNDYHFDNINNIITLNQGIAIDGDAIIVEIFRDHDFEIRQNQLFITKNYKTVNKDYILFTSFTNHDQWKVMRSNKEFTFTNGFEAVPYDITTYDTFGTSVNTSGIFNLPRTVSDNSGVLVSLSRRLLVLGIDYVLLDNLKQIKVILPDLLTKSDYIEIITTNPKVSRESFGFRIFKDMLNRTQYKRLDGKKSTKLAADLNFYDTIIQVEDSTLLDAPNQLKNLPGVVNINAERIEYMIKDGNKLRQLRRGTLGTPINNFSSAGTSVTSMSYGDTMPYEDKEEKYTFVADTATTENFGITFGSFNGIVYGTNITMPDHTIYATLSINQVDIQIALISGIDIDTYRNDIKNAINFYSNITGVLADRIIDETHPYISNNTNGIDLISVPISVPINSFVNKQGNGPYYVTFSIDEQVFPFKVGSDFTVSGSANTNFNGTYSIYYSTHSLVTLEYASDPGEYTDKLAILSFENKEGNGPYFITYFIPERSAPPTIGVGYNITGHLNNKFNSLYYGEPLIATASTKTTITFLYQTDPGVYNTYLKVLSKFSKVDNHDGTFDVTYNIEPQTDAPDIGIYYNVSGSEDVIDYSVFKNTSFYNGIHLAVASTSSKVTLRYNRDPGIFIGGNIALNSLPQIESIATLNKPSDNKIIIANVYLMPISFVPTKSQAAGSLEGWYRETIPVYYSQTDEIEVFANGYRLSKVPIVVYDQDLAQDSFGGTGDKTIEADFSIDSINPNIRFTSAPTPGTNIVVVTKKGYIWYNVGETVQLAYSNSRVAKFITSTTVDLPK